MIDDHVEFYESLEEGDLVVATTFGVKVEHVIRLTELADESGRKQTDDELGPRYWRGKCIGCGTKGNGYFWRVSAPPNRKGLPRRVCKKAKRQWERDDQPPVRGFTDRLDEEPPEIWVATGWSEVEPKGHPDDEDYEYNDEEMPLTEVQRWERGQRYVRLVELEDHPGGLTHGVHYGWIDEPDSDRNSYRGGHAGALERCESLMRRGGRL